MGCISRLAVAPQAQRTAAPCPPHWSHPSAPSVRTSPRRAMPSSPVCARRARAGRSGQAPAQQPRKARRRRPRSQPAACSCSAGESSGLASLGGRTPLADCVCRVDGSRRTSCTRSTVYYNGLAPAAKLLVFATADSRPDARLVAQARLMGSAKLLGSVLLTAGVSTHPPRVPGPPIPSVERRGRKLRAPSTQAVRARA